jgi:hypothetical protein
MARRLTARPSPAWVGDLPVFERTLANGLKALVLPRRHAPVVVCDLYYPVGSYDEPTGKSGLAHFVEHMLFKGTERFPKGQIDRLASSRPGSPTPRPARTARITGSPSPPTAGSWRWRSSRTGCEARPSMPGKSKPSAR